MMFATSSASGGSLVRIAIVFGFAATTPVGAVLGGQPSKPRKAEGGTATPLNLFEMHKQDYVAGKEPALVDVEPAKYLTIAGRGAPGGELFVKRVGVLYGVAFSVKAKSAIAGRDYYYSAG